MKKLFTFILLLTAIVGYSQDSLTTSAEVKKLPVNVSLVTNPHLKKVFLVGVIKFQ